MALMNWKPEYDTGIGSIDTQHKKLVQMVCELNTAMLAGKGKDVLGKILSDMIAYTQQHFAHEERLMSQAGYGALAAHKKEHEALAAQAVELRNKFQSTGAGLSTQTAVFLKDWLNKHILGTDQLYAPHLRGRVL